MCAAKLKESLSDCLINFDRRVLLTDLVNEYEIPLPAVHDTLADYIAQQEQEGVKYEKQFLVHGIDAQNSNKEIFTIVQGDGQLREWLRKLVEAESSLYSVEVAGGAKAPAEDLRPVRWAAIKVKDLALRAGGKTQTNGAANGEPKMKEAIKTEEKKPVGIAAAFTKANPSVASCSATATSTKSTDNTKKAAPAEKITVKAEKGVKKSTPPEKKPVKAEKEAKKTSPPEKRTASGTSKTAAAAPKKSIGSFFTPAAKAPEKQVADSASADSGVMRQKTPKKLQDFFKKQTETAAIATAKDSNKKANTSMQLFVEEDEPKESIKIADESSSDEEEQLDALRRKVVGSDDDEAQAASSSNRKRLRIVDSDDESNEAAKTTEPQQKQGKIEETVNVEDSPPKSEAFLDEDGFVITVKSKKSTTKPAARRTETPVKSEPKESKPKQMPTSTAAKTKQGNIMNFFKKK